MADPSGVISHFVSVVGEFFGYLFLFVILLVGVIMATFPSRIEQRLQEDYPELWAEYSPRLKEGEGLAFRLDLVVEICEKLLPILIEELESEEIPPDVSPAVTPPPNSEAGSSESSTSSSSTIRMDNTVDAEVAEMKDGKNKK